VQGGQGTKQEVAEKQRKVGRGGESRGKVGRAEKQGSKVERRDCTEDQDENRG
jgi:hypothetical protein